MIRFIIIYRPPSNNYISFLNDLNDLLATTQLDNTILLGDFNFHINLNDTPSSNLISLTDSHSLHQHINKPTHIGGNTLYLIFTSIYSTQILKVLNIKYLITDHFAIIFNINIPKPKVNT